MINEEYGFEYEQETPWHEIFAEAPVSPRAAADGAAAAPVTFKTLAEFLAHADLPDSDADDSSFKYVQRISLEAYVQQIYGALHLPELSNCSADVTLHSALSGCGLTGPPVRVKRV